MLKYILALLVIVAVWVAWVFLSVIPIWVPIAVTALTLLLLVAIVLVRVIRARRAASQLERALAEQAAQHARSARPDVQAEIMEVKAEFEKAIAALKTSKLGKGGNSLYALPWQLIIGPPGVGKTTALRNSGLQFPYLSSKTKGGVKGIGGTRNCDWWLTNESVILDTAGRWATEEEDREEWLGFLDLLKRFRPRKPLNGIIAAVSIADLGGATEDEVTALAQKIRERIDEAMNRLQMSLPVYVMFTKCDLVPGFVETFGDLSKSDRGQIWGFTVPVSEKVSPGEHFNTRFDHLASALDQRLLKRMGDERRIETREMIYIFPRQLAVLKANMGAFVEQLFEENVFQETPAFRGVYFSSGTQEGRPIDRVMHRMAEAFGIQSALPFAQVTEPKSYFLRDVFKEVVFQDAGLAVRSQAELRRQRRTRYLVAAAMFGIALLLLTFPVYSWVQNRELLDDTQRVLAPGAGPQAAGMPLAPASMDRLQEQVDLLQEHEADGAPVLMRSGMYQGSSVREPLVQLYAHRIRDGVVTTLFRQLQDELNGFVQLYGALDTSIPPADQYQANYARLRTYLFLTVPGEASQPPLAAEVQDELATELARRWAAALNIPFSGATGDSMRRHMAAYVATMAESPDVAFPRDPNMVIRVRTVLNRVPTIRLAVQGFIDEFSNRGLDLTLEQLVGGARVPALRAREKVRAAFTRRVWEDHIRDRLEQPMDRLTGEPWVLGDTSRRGSEEEEQEARRAEVRRQYLEGYINEWHRFLFSLYVMPPVDNQEALELMHALTNGQPTPFQSLLTQTHYNVQIKTHEEEQAEAEAGSGAGAKAAQKGIMSQVERRLSKSAVGRIGMSAVRAEAGGAPGAPGGPAELSTADVRLHFDGFTRFGVAPPPAAGQPPASTPLIAYEEQLAFVRNALQTYMDDPSTADALVEQIQKARTEVAGMIEEQEVGWRPAFKAVLWPPIDGSSFSVSKNLAKGVGRSWCAEVVEPHDMTVVGRYPFERDGSDMSFDDFGAFYSPTGVLWAYYDEVLKTHVGQLGDDFEFNTRLGKSAGDVFQPDLVRFLQRSRDITHVFYPPGAEDPRVEFDLRVRPSPEIAIQQVTVGGKMIEYHNGPEEWHRFSWPGEDDPGGGALIEIWGHDGMHERVVQQGEWGLFHLIEAGTVTPGGGRVFTVVWHLRTHDVDITIDFRPVREDTPFFGVVSRNHPALLAPMRWKRAELEPPRDITIGGHMVCKSRPAVVAIATPRGT
jgi:type VI secretion system protein ImpL